MPSPFPGMDPYLESRQLWPDVHARLIVAIGDALAPLVEPAYYVAVEERVYLAAAEPDQHVIRPDVAVIGAREPASSAGGVAVASVVGPATQTVIIPRYERLRVSFLEIREAATHELITSIEILSPTNKLPGAGRDEYEAKRGSVFLSRTNLVEIDLLRAGKPMEMHPSPAADYRLLVTVGWEYPCARLQTFRLPQPIPDLQIPLREKEAAVALPLGQLLNAVYDRARYQRRLDYRGAPPEPPLTPDDAAWANELLRANSLRE